MKINLSPVFSEDTISAFVNGDSITVNGLEFDFSKLPKGYELPASAIDSIHFVGRISRGLDSVIELTLRFPHPFNASEDMRFPKSLVCVGNVQFPVNTPKIVEKVVIEVPSND